MSGTVFVYLSPTLQPPRAVAAGLLLWARLAEDINRQASTALSSNASSVMLSADVRS